MEKKRALVLGCNGFIGYNLVKRLKEEGFYVLGVDKSDKNHAGEKSNADEFICEDLRGDYFWIFLAQCTTKDELLFDEMYQLAADMGGAGYIFTGENDYDVMMNSQAINHNCAKFGHLIAKKIFFSSSACVYPICASGGNDSTKECDAYPANPDSEYGWEKLFAERQYLAANRKLGFPLFRIARFHNVFGPFGTYKGGKEKAPAAMIRKAIETPVNGVLDVWGTGEQTRTFLYIDDCLDAIRLLMDHPSFEGPVNIGSEEEITINGLAKMALDIAVSEAEIKNIDGPVGVNARKSDNELIETILGWYPKISLRSGMERTFTWIESEMKKNG